MGRYYPCNFTAKLLTPNFSDTISTFPLRVLPSSILKRMDLPNALPLIYSQYHRLFEMACLRTERLQKDVCTGNLAGTLSLVPGLVWTTGMWEFTWNKLAQINKYFY